MTLVGLLIYLLVGVLILSLLMWAVTLMPDPPFTPATKNIVKIILILIAVLVLLSWFFGVGGLEPLRVRW